MKVKELLTMDIDVDVFDDVCDSLAIAFCGPAELTEAGKEHFAKALEMDCGFNKIGYCIVHVDDPDEKTWTRNLKQAKELFYGLAGYCSEADYNKWFKEG